MVSAEMTHLCFHIYAQATLDRICGLNSGVATGGQWGQSATPDGEKFAKNREKRGKIRTNGEKRGKIGKKRQKSGKVLSLCAS